MSSPESLRGIVDITSHVKKVNAYQVGTHFLNPNGEHHATYKPVETPTLASLDTINYPDELSDLSRLTLGWIDFYSYPEVTQVGKTFVATNYCVPESTSDSYVINVKAYSFRTLDELIDSPELPIFTAEWLARMLKADNDTSRLQSRRQPVNAFIPLELKEPLKLQRDIHETLTERCVRLAKLAFEADTRSIEQFTDHG